MSAENEPDCKDLLAGYDRDVFLYNGEINYVGYYMVSSILEGLSEKRKSACLILATLGGDPNAAFRIARALQHHYTEGFEVLIPGMCKSSGTLLAIGADALIFGDRGELGPLDIQLSKSDEMFEFMSGLDIGQAINDIKQEALRAFRAYLVDIRKGSRIQTKIAADIAVRLTEALISPMASKIDPVTYGQHQRAMRIAYDYGYRLNDRSRNLEDELLRVLLSQYPSHDFVIDRKEAKLFFKNVDRPQGATLRLYDWYHDQFKNMILRDAHVWDIRDVFSRSIKTFEEMINDEYSEGETQHSGDLSSEGAE